MDDRQLERGIVRQLEPKVGVSQLAERRVQESGCYVRRDHRDLLTTDYTELPPYLFTIAKPFTPAEIRRYDAVRYTIKARMRATDRSVRITYDRLADTLGEAGFARSARYLRAVLNGEKRSCPALREISAAIDAIGFAGLSARQREERHLPNWL